MLLGSIEDEKERDLVARQFKPAPVLDPTSYEDPFEDTEWAGAMPPWARGGA